MTRPLHLSPRQIEVCILIAAGYSDKAVGRELGVCKGTVGKYLKDAATRIRQAFPHIDGERREIVRTWYVECRFQAYHAKRSAGI